MSVERSIFIVCDGCSERHGETYTIAATKAPSDWRRELARNAGWLKIGAIDLCGQCADDPKTIARVTDRITG